jgi:hypothetical protein
MQSNTSNTPARTNQGTRTLTLLGVAFMGAGLAMFMWWKMRMVTGVPRTAYAEPRLMDQTPAPDAQPATAHVPVEAVVTPQP